MILEFFTELVSLFMEMSPYLLLGLVFAGVLHLYFTREWVVRQVGRSNLPSVTRAVLFGIPMPLCSCGVVPTALYLSQNGASSAAVVAFLISTPQTGVDSILATFGMMGGLFAVFRPLAAFFMGIAGGWLAMLFRDASPDLNPAACCDRCEEDSPNAQSRRHKGIRRLGANLREIYDYAFVRFLDDISLQFLAGLGIAALIACLIPEDFFAGMPLLSRGIPGMLFMILAGIPLYVCATASIPIAVTLMAKGVSPGVAFVFLSTGPATNLVSIAMLYRVLGKKTTALYVGVIAVFSIVFGVLLDALFAFFEIAPAEWIRQMRHEPLVPAGLQAFFAVLFVLALSASFWRKIRARLGRSSPRGEPGAGRRREFAVRGMTCHACAENVHQAVSNLPGVENASVDLDRKRLVLEGTFDDDNVKNAVRDSGYSLAS